MKEDKNKKAQESSQVNAKNSSIDLKDFKTLEDFQKFITKRNITSSKELYSLYPSLYNRMHVLKFLTQVHYTPIYMSKKEDFQKLIIENAIINISDFKRRFTTVFNKCRKLHLVEKLEYLDINVDYDFSNINTIDEINSFINSKKITTRSDLKVVYAALYTKVNNFYSPNQLKFYNHLLSSDDLQRLKTLEDFQAVIDKNHIKNNKELQENGPDVFRKAEKLGLLKSIKFSDKYFKNLDFNLNTLKDYQQFVDKNSISCATEFISVYPGVYSMLHRRGFSKQIIYSNPKNIKRNLKTVADFQKFIDENNIQNTSDFILREGSVYSLMSYAGFCKEVHYPDPHRSVGEKRIENFLLSENFSFVHDTCADFLTKQTRLDFRLDKYKIAIEYQGCQHFIESENFNITLSEQQRKDKRKYDDCIHAGYTILYVVFPEIDSRYKQVDFENLKYFDKIYFSLDELKIRILEIIDEYNKTHLGENSNNPQDGEGTGV